MYENFELLTAVKSMHYKMMMMMMMMIVMVLVLVLMTVFMMLQMIMKVKMISSDDTNWEINFSDAFTMPMVTS